MPENDESFVVKLTYATFNARFNVSEITLTILANDAPIRFSQVGIKGKHKTSVCLPLSRALAIVRVGVLDLLSSFSSYQ